VPGDLAGLLPTEGWAVVHCFYRIDRARLLALTPAERDAAAAELVAWLTAASAAPETQFVPLAGVTKFDFGFLAIDPDVWRVQQLTQEIGATAFGSCLIPHYSFLSLTEASEYITNELDWTKMLLEQERLDPVQPEFGRRIEALRKRTAMYSDSRVHPRLPDDYPLVCFYPMAKARRDRDNWYRLSFEERKKLMIAHGEAGRRFASRITQMITTSTGLDDWEWGVTLFSKDLRAFRDIVYELRYDAASAIYGLFGPFLVGIRFAPEQARAVLRL
jgi:chlorite dismutase